MTTKATKFADFIAEHNKALGGSKDAKEKHWNVTFSALEKAATPTVQLTAEHPATKSTILLVWNGDTEVYNYPESVFTRDGDNGGEWTIRNVSEARKIVLGEIVKGGTGDGPRRGRATRATTPTGEKSTTPARKTRRTKADPDDRPVTDVPFKLDDPDDVIIELLKGKTIKWRRGAIKMTSKVFPNHLKIEKSKTNADRRYIQFADDDGFKTVYLDLITKVLDS